MPLSSWTDTSSCGFTNGQQASGVIYLFSTCTMAAISDGTSNTYLIGEKNLSPDDYLNGLSGGDDQGWIEGFDSDIVRKVGNNTTTSAYVPLIDTPGVDDAWCFGSAHASGFNMAFCDGSIRSISYMINAEVHRRLGNRKDGQPIDGSQL
jgi:prepilin-type processing-associated H-X9-DG protein